MNFKELYTDLLNTPFPPIVSNNEVLTDIIIDLRMYDDYVSGTIHNYLSKKGSLNPELSFDNQLEKRLIDFIENDQNSNEEINSAKENLSYLQKIKDLLNKFN